MNKNKLTPEEIDDLRKSLKDIGMEDDEINTVIEKAEKGEEDEGDEEKEGKDEKDEGSEKGESNAESKNIIDSMIKMRDNMSKAIKVLVADDKEEDSFEKSIGDKFASIEMELSEIKKSLEPLGLIEDLQETVQTMSEISKGVRAVKNGEPRYFSRTDDDEGTFEKSLSKDRDEIIKSLQGMVLGEQNTDKKRMLEDGIMELSVNGRSTSPAAIFALKEYAQKNKTTLVK